MADSSVGLTYNSAPMALSPRGRGAGQGAGAGRPGPAGLVSPRGPPALLASTLAALPPGSFLRPDHWQLRGAARSPANAIPKRP